MNSLGSDGKGSEKFTWNIMTVEHNTEIAKPTGQVIKQESRIYTHAPLSNRECWLTWNRVRALPSLASAPSSRSGVSQFHFISRRHLSLMVRRPRSRVRTDCARAEALLELWWTRKCCITQVQSQLQGCQGWLGGSPEIIINVPFIWCP